MANGQGQETDQQRFARVLKNAREAEDLMKSDVAYTINVSRAAVDVWEHGGSESLPCIRNALQLVALLDIPVEDVAGIGFYSAAHHKSLEITDEMMRRYREIETRLQALGQTSDE